MSDEFYSKASERLTIYFVVGLVGLLMMDVPFWSALASAAIASLVVVPLCWKIQNRADQND